MKVILPGSYDPVTLGHLDVIKRAAKAFDEVYAVVFINSEKKYTFSADDRVKMLSLATEDLSNVTVDFSEGLVIDYMRKNGISKIVKGYRNDVDLEYEKKQAQYNLLNGGFETVFWRSDEKFADISSTRARLLIEKGEQLSEILPEKVISFINNH